MPSGGASNPVDIRNGLVGNLKINNFDSGQQANAATVWGGDGHWRLFGYAVGAGGSVTQLTSITTAVHIDRPTGQIITFNGTFTANTLVTFTVNNAFVLATDIIALTTNPAGAIVYANNPGPGSFQISIYPLASATATLAINFAIIRGQIS